MDKILITKLSDEGRGLGHNQKPYFVTGALPKEEVSVKVLKKYKGIIEAVATEVPINKSEHRVAAKCQHFLQCGGCSLQHMQYDYQVEFKAKKLQQLWQDYGYQQPEWQVALAGPEFAYRRKARVSIRYVEKKQKLLLGFKELDARKILDMQSCEVLTKAIQKHLFALQALLSDLPEANLIPQLELVEALEGVVVVIRHLQPLSDATQQRLNEFANTSGWQVWSQAKGPDTIKPLNASHGFLHYELPEFNLKLAFAPLDFVQVNAKVNQLMLSKVLSWLELKSYDRVLDLFCGLGNFSLPIAQNCAQVIGVEGSDEMVLRAKTNAMTAGLAAKTEFYAQDLRQAPAGTWAQAKFNKVLLDPPRSGAKACLEWLVTKRPERLVYVSCNPKSLLNDIAILFEHGYKAKFACIADMFPHTGHTEALVCFELLE